MFTKNILILGFLEAMVSGDKPQLVLKVSQDASIAWALFICQGDIDDGTI